MILRVAMAETTPDKHKIDKIPEEQRKWLFKTFSGNEKSDYSWYSFSSIEQFIDSQDLKDIPEGCMEVLSFKPLRTLKHFPDLPDLNNIKLKDANEILGKVLQIHLPGNELLKFNQLAWFEDSCTEVIQRELDKGWRIISVLPQAGFRRPDYILGKVDE